MKKNYIIATIMSILLFSTFLASCGSKARFLKDSEIKDVDTINGVMTLTTKLDRTDRDLERDIEITMSFVLYYKYAPNTVNNFITLANTYYVEKDKNTIIDTFSASVFEGGNFYQKYDEDSDDYVKTEKKLNYNIIGEMFSNGWGTEENVKKLEMGSMYMVLSNLSEYNTAASRFSISLREDTSKKLTESKRLSIFGKVGYSTIKISDVNDTIITEQNTIEDIVNILSRGFILSYPQNPIFITSIEIDNTVDLGKVLKIK